jgi:capsular polysaccharide export protein
MQDGSVTDDGGQISICARRPFMKLEPQPEFAAHRARTFLFLQGPVGAFFSRLAAALAGRGHGIRRIHFNGGDRACWHAGNAVDFRGSAGQWRPFLVQVLRDAAITDLVLFGDCRPLHREAIALARERHLTVHVFEEGYLRPSWITLEQGGVNRASPLPRDAQAYRDLSRLVPELAPSARFRSTFAQRAFADIAYNLASLLLAWRYPHYRTHKPWHPLKEYRHGAPRFIAGAWRRRRAAGEVEQILGGGAPYYVFPLQLDGDAQIRFHSRYGHMQPAIEEVIASFAAHAPAETALVITEHPLDWGVLALEPVVRAAAQERGIADRVRFLPGGSPDALLRSSQGIVTVNSTVGLHALALGISVKALAAPLYDLPGLCCQAPLDGFWREPTRPDAELVGCFRRVVAAHSQIHGGFHGREAIQLAAEEAAQRLCGSAVLRSQAMAALPALQPG